MGSIFAAERLRHEIAHIEFRYFLKNARSDIESICRSLERFEALKKEFSFGIVSSNEEDHLQVEFRKRKLAFKDLEGNAAIEKGPSLVYTIGRTGGVVTTILFPASSPLGGVPEDHIFLRIGPYSAHQLRSRLRGDLTDLVSYAFVSGLETDPSIRDRLRFWWLRTTHPHSVEKKFVRPLTPGKLFTSASKFTITSLVVALMKPLAFVIAYIILVYLGLSSLTQHLH